MDSPGRRIQPAATFQNVTLGLCHVQRVWQCPFQGLTPAGSGRQVREGSTTFFTNQTRNAIPARQSGVRASPMLTTLLAAKKTVPCPWNWTWAWAWAWHDQAAMLSAWYGEVQPPFPVPQVRSYKPCICMRLHLTSKSESESGSTGSGSTSTGSGFTK